VNVVVTREAGRNEGLKAWTPPGASVDEVPLTTTTYFDDDDVRAALDGSSLVGNFRSLVVTSERGVKYVELALRAAALDAEVFSVGPTTTEQLTSYGVHVRAQGEGTAETLARHIARGPVLMLGAKTTSEGLATALRDKGLEVVSVACYETIGLSLTSSDAQTVRDADVLFIGAPSAWAVARDLVTDDTWVVVPGASTGAVVRADHRRVIEGWGPHLATRLAELSR
jgi:uroporphyrinogen-III synthase